MISGIISKRRAMISAGAVAAAISTAPESVLADAVNIDEEPMFGSVSLEAGFDPDPYVVEVRAGGDFGAAVLGADCHGFINAERPNFRLDYSAGTYELGFYVEGHGDHTLVVNTPSGNWLCNDDHPDASDRAPGILIPDPESGSYEVWAGVYEDPRDGTPGSALVVELGITEGDFPWALRSESYGTAFFVSSSGHLLTSHHVVVDCSTVTVHSLGTVPVDAVVIATNPSADLALLKTEVGPDAHAVFRASPPLRQGELVVTYGFPLPSELSSQGNLAVGYLTAITGYDDDLDQFQLSAPIQDGSSGSPVADGSGHVVGVVDSTLNGDDPEDPNQQVNFAVHGSAAARFLEANNVHLEWAASVEEVSIPDVADDLRDITAMLSCE